MLKKEFDFEISAALFLFVTSSFSCAEQETGLNNKF